MPIDGPRSWIDAKPATVKGAPEARALAVGRDADHVDLTQRLRLDRGMVVQLRPTEAGDAAVVEREQEARRVEPRLRLPLLERGE